MHIYRLKWPDGLTAVAMVYFEGDAIVSITMTGAKVRLVALAELKSAAEFDTQLLALAKTQNVEVIRKTS